MSITRAWKVYGGYDAVNDYYHRQRESFCDSYVYNSSKGDNIRIIEVENSDKTGTNEYTIIRITRNTAAECEAELMAQIGDGIFENSRVGKWEEIL